MTAMPSWIAGDLVVGEIINRAQHIGLIGRVGVGIEMPGQAFGLRQPPSTTPLLTA
jgi:hypothetical protein